METLRIELNRESGPPLYLQLSDALASEIQGGRLMPGQRLPSERDLAATLGVSRTTVVNAYGELQARGLARGQVGRGTYVNAPPDATGAPFAWRGKVSRGALRTIDPTLRWLANTASVSNVISFAAAIPALDRFPMDAYREVTDAVLRDGALRSLGLCPTEGHPALRETVARQFKARPEEILIISGAQQGLDLISRCLIDPGDVVLMDRPGYVGAIQTFRAAGAHLVGWDFERADLDELEDLIIRYEPKVLYTNPTFQNPTGRTLPLSKRLELLDLAARYRLPIIEDEPYRDLPFDGRPPDTLYHLDTNRLVIHIHTYSKTLASGLRLGWLAAADEIVDQLALFKQRCDVSSASLEQLVVARILRSDVFERHMSRLRAEHARRHQAMIEALESSFAPGIISYRPAEGGLYIWATLHGSYDTRDLLQQAATQGVLFVPGAAFDPDGYTKRQLRLCFSAEPPERIATGIRRIAGLTSTG